MSLTTLGLLTAPEDVASLRNEWLSKQTTLNYQKLSAELRKQKAEETAGNLEADIAVTQTELAAYTTLLATMPDGTVKTEMENRKRKAENRLWEMEQRKNSLGIKTVVMMESLIEELNARLVVVQSHLTSLDAL